MSFRLGFLAIGPTTRLLLMSQAFLSCVIRPKVDAKIG